MENNSSKQILLSVIGVAILVIAVVGVSFAFFTYTRTGEKDNVITTGTLTFAFKDSSFITLVDHFPISDATGLPTTDATCVFTVEGSASANANIGYTVYAIAGTLAEDGNAYEGKERFKDSEVFINLTSTGSAFTPVTGIGENAGLAIGSLSKDATGQYVLGTGTVTAGTDDYSTTFTAKMWVSSTVVSINDDNGATSTTDSIYTTEQYGNLYYTMRIKVEAQA